MLLSIPLGYFELGVRTVSAPNFERNYGWFKDQETAMSAIRNNICDAKTNIEDFTALYGDANQWTKTTKEQYNDLVYIKSGYVQKYNSLVAEYNSRRSNFIKEFGRDDDTPREYVEFYDKDCERIV